MLVWAHSRGSLNVLQLVFGLLYSDLSVYLRFDMHLIVKSFRNYPLARLSNPLAEEIEMFKAAFAEQCHLLNDCWAPMDGLKLYLRTAGNAHIQEWFYNRWTHDHYCTFDLNWQPLNWGGLYLRFHWGDNLTLYPMAQFVERTVP